MTDLSGSGRPRAEPRQVADLRAAVIAHLDKGQMYEAMGVARALLEQHPGLRTYRFLRTVLDTPAAGTAGLKNVRVALLSSFSIEFIHDSLVALGFVNGLKLEIFQAGFGAFRQELLDPGSALYRWSPDVVVLAVEGEDWIPEVYARYFELPKSGFDKLVHRIRNEFHELVGSLRAYSTASLLTNNLAFPCWRSLGILDAKTARGQGKAIDDVNAALSAVARDITDVHIVDYCALVNRHGALNWYDERMRFYARAPIANGMQPHLAAEYVKFLCALTGLTKKCLVVDLDNTLWGGVVGEDGVDGIQLGANYPGSAYVAFQRLLCDLHQRGVILAVASKNNPADVDEVLAKHPFMVLKRGNFANMQIHWEAKSQSLERIARELSIGLEHMVFVDDNPAECEQVRRSLPMVRVIKLPPQPENYVRAVQEAGLFDTLSISAEDRRRGELYVQRAQAEAARASVGSVEDYYRDLAMELAIRPVDKTSITRAAQLTQKTNQFNVTTLRYSESEIGKRMQQASWIANTVSVKDRFGDNGIVGVVMAHQNRECLEVDTLLLSCRIIGRTVETAMLADLCDEGRRRGVTAITGRIVPTAKNAPARDVFERHGFAKVDEESSGATLWRLDLDTNRVQWPTWFRRET